VSASQQASFSVTYRRLLGYLWPLRWTVAFAFIGMALDAACGSAFIKFIKDIIDSIFTGNFDRPQTSAEKPLSAPAPQPVAPAEPPAGTPFDTDAT